MRRILGLTLAATLGTALTACGGGGSSSTPAAAPAPVSTAAPIQGVTNFSGPSGSVTVSIKVPGPAKTHPSAVERAKVAAFRASHPAQIRTLANTSPSASVRAAAQSASRKPAFISPSTYFLEFVLTDSSNVVQTDQFGSCYTGNCTNSFGAPVLSGMTVTLYLYDYSYTLIAAGSTSGVSVTLGNTTPVTVTLNGVVTYLSVQSSNNGPFLDDPSGSTGFNVSVIPEDYYGNTITTPGILLDSTLTPIASVTLSVDADTLPSAPQSLTPNPDLSFGPVAYTYQGGSMESAINFTATEVPAGGGPIILANNSYGPAGTQVGTDQISMTPTSLTWTNPQGYPAGSFGDPIFVNNGGSPNATAFSVEFPLATNSAIYNFGLTDTSTTFGPNITITDNGLCTTNPIASYNPVLGPSSYAALHSSPYFELQMGSNGASSGCVITASDGANTSTLSVFTDSSTLLIQNKARKH